METRDFYINLGRILYAVAKADGTVQDEELQAIYKMVINELSDGALFNNEDEIDSFYTEFEFEALLVRNANMHDSLLGFHDFYLENAEFFTSDMKKTTLKAMNVVAEAYLGIIPAEQELIDKISTLMNS